MKNMEDVLTRPVNRRSFIKNGAIAAGAATVGAGLLSHGLAAFAQDTNRWQSHPGRYCDSFSSWLPPN
jgi:anaerobic selenocysteine-containing dehydrogenase